MARKKPPEDQPTPGPEPEPNPDPSQAPEPEPASEPPAGEVTIPADALESLQIAYIDRGISLSDRDREIEELRALVARQAIELGQAAENAQSLEKSREKVKRLKDRLMEAKEEAAAAKKAHEAALEAHLELERELLTGQGRLPFPPPDAPEAAPAPATPTATAVPAPGPSAPAPALPSADAAADGDQSWRAVPLGTLGIRDELPHAIVARLEDAGIVTVGDLADFARPSPGGHCKRLVDIDGIGQAKAEKIEAALDAFWRNWSAWQAQKAAEAAHAATDEGEVIDPEFETVGDDLDPSDPADDLGGLGDDEDDDGPDDGVEF